MWLGIPTADINCVRGAYSSSESLYEFHGCHAQELVPILWKQDLSFRTNGRDESIILNVWQGWHSIYIYTYHIMSIIFEYHGKQYPHQKWSSTFTFTCLDQYLLHLHLVLIWRHLDNLNAFIIIPTIAVYMVLTDPRTMTIPQRLNPVTESILKRDTEDMCQLVCVVHNIEISGLGTVIILFYEYVIMALSLYHRFTFGTYPII